MWCYDDEVVELLQRIAFLLAKRLEEVAFVVVILHDNLWRYAEDYGCCLSGQFFLLPRIMAACGIACMDLIVMLQQMFHGIGSKPLQVF